jgi:type VI secretion system secreted protein VgrG
MSDHNHKIHVQNERARIDTPLPQIEIGAGQKEDALLLQNFTYREELGHPFELTLELLSSKGNINFNEILGKSVTVTINDEDHQKRYLNGIVKHIALKSFTATRGLYSYVAVVVPKLSLLQLSATSRAWQGKTRLELVEEIFNHHGVAFSIQTSHVYVPREFCVQYREADYNFVHRLMENAGITYYFQHENGKHTLVLCDDYGGFQKGPSVRYTHDVAIKGAIHELSHDAEICTQIVKLNDHDYNLRTKLQGTARAAIEVNWGGEIEDYPGGFHDGEGVGEGPGPDRYAMIKLQQLICQRLKIRGAATSAKIIAGQVIMVDNLPDDHPLDNVAGLPASYKNGCLIIKAELKYITPRHEDGDRWEEGRNPYFQTNFVAIPQGVRFCNPQSTPRPVIAGLQTAVVAGGEEDTAVANAYGNIKVTLRWDHNNTQALWIRASQISAGKGWGSMFIPHVGNEVVIAFEEGNPERPVVIGCVYNSANMPPISPQKFNQRSYITDQAGNRLVFYQNKGSESIIMYSPFHDSMSTVGKFQ